MILLKPLSPPSTPNEGLINVRIFPQPATNISYLCDNRFSPDYFQQRRTYLYLCRIIVLVRISIVILMIVSLYMTLQSIATDILSLGASDGKANKAMAPRTTDIALAVWQNRFNMRQVI